MNFSTKNENGQVTKTNREAGVFTKRIGYTVYHVGVYFSDTSKETARDKILRLIQNEAAHQGTPLNRRFNGERTSDGVSELSGLRGSERYEVREDEKAANL